MIGSHDSLNNLVVIGSLFYWGSVLGPETVLIALLAHDLDPDYSAAILAARNARSLGLTSANFEQHLSEHTK